MSIPDGATPPIPTDPQEDTVQAMYTDDDEVLISFDPKVLDWYPSVVIPLPQQELFEYLLSQLQKNYSWQDIEEIVRFDGRISESGIDIREMMDSEERLISMYASSRSEQRLTLEISVPDRDMVKETLRQWISISDVAHSD